MFRCKLFGVAVVVVNKVIFCWHRKTTYLLYYMSLASRAIFDARATRMHVSTYAPFTISYLTVCLFALYLGLFFFGFSDFFFHSIFYNKLIHNPFFASTL